MEKKENKRRINSISIISSAVCNLQCEFCYLHKNKSYGEFNKKVMQAWDDGSYLKNMYATLEKLNVDFPRVNTMQLWGGETLLYIEKITENIENIYYKFPNINTWRISSNWTIDANRLFEFFKEIERCTNQPTQILLQMSIDGPPGPISEKGHNGDWNKYRENIKIITDFFNNTKFEKIKCVFSINATVGKDLYLQEFSTYEGIKNYVSYMREFTKFIEERCISKSLELGTPYVFPGLALPHDFTVQEGLELTRINRLWEYIRANEFPDFPINFGFDFGIGQLIVDKENYTNNPECSELKNSLTILPDGSICECSGAYMYRDEGYLKELEENGEIDLLRQARLSGRLTHCPKDMTEEELEEVKWWIDNGIKSNQSTYLNLMMAEVEEMALAGQIPYKYYLDKELAFNHVVALSSLISCTRDNHTSTHIAFLLNPSAIRRFFNGLVEYSYENSKLFNKEKLNGNSKRPG